MVYFVFGNTIYPMVALAFLRFGPILGRSWAPLDFDVGPQIIHNNLRRDLFGLLRSTRAIFCPFPRQHQIEDHFWILYRRSNKATYHWNYSIICVSMKIDNMLHCDCFGVQKCRLLGPCWGLFLLFEAPRAAKSRTSRTATPFLLIFESVQNGSIFEGSRGRSKNDPCAPWDGQGTRKTPWWIAGSSVLSSWLPWRGSRARQGLININQKSKKNKEPAKFLADYLTSHLNL